MSSWDIALSNATCVMVGITTLYQALRSICSMGPADPYAPIGEHIQLAPTARLRLENQVAVVTGGSEV